MPKVAVGEDHRPIAWFSCRHRFRSSAVLFREDEAWERKDLRKTCAAYYDEHMPESSIEMLGHSIGGARGAWNKPSNDDYMQRFGGRTVLFRSRDRNAAPGGAVIAIRARRP